jgi:hypothetical protein
MEIQRVRRQVIAKQAGFRRFHSWILKTVSRKGFDA